MKRARSNKDKGTRRRLLLDSALDEFFERGYAAARMDDIAKRANLSKGTLYLYFDSKEALFGELINAVALPKLEELSGLAAAAPSYDAALEMIASFAPRVVKHSNIPRLAKVLIGESNNFPHIVASYRQNVLEKILAIFANVLKRAKERGEIQLSDPHLGARLIMAPILFSGIWSVTFGVNDSKQLDVEGLIGLQMSLFKNLANN